MLRMDVNFALSDSNNKDQLRNLYNYLNQKVIIAINTYHSFMLGNNLITSHQVDYMPSALIPAEAVEDNHKHLAANKVGSITSLV